MDFNKRQRFSIRKFKVGAFSVLIGAVLVGVPVAEPLLDHFGYSTTVHAEGTKFDQAIKGATKVVPYGSDPAYADRVKVSYKKGDDGYLYWTVVFNNSLDVDGSGYYSFTVPNGVGTPENWDIKIYSSKDVVTHHFDSWPEHAGGTTTKQGAFHHYDANSGQVGAWAKPKQEQTAGFKQVKANTQQFYTWETNMTRNKPKKAVITYRTKLEPSVKDINYMGYHIGSTAVSGQRHALIGVTDDTVTVQSDQYDPTPKEQTVGKGATVDPKGSIGNTNELPEGTTYSWKEDATPDTSTSGRKEGVVVVRYPDGSTDEVPVTVNVTADTDKYDPKGKDQTVENGAKPDPKLNIENPDGLPEGTKFEYKDPIDTTTPGDKPVTVVVTYPDGSTDEVPGKVIVTPQKDKFNPTGKDQEVEKDAQPDPKLNVENPDALPEGTTFKYKDPIDTSTPGEKPVTVVITYPDGSTDEVTGKVTVGKQADKYTPKPKDRTLDIGSKTDPKPSISNTGEMPNGTKYTWKPGTEPDVSTPGVKNPTVVVTYPDGSTDEVPVKITVRPHTDKYNPTGKDQTVDNGAQPDPKLNIENPDELPEGTKFEYKDPIDTTTPGDKPVTVVVTYPDGSKDEVPSKVTVTPQKDKYEPTPKDQTVDNGAQPDPKLNIENPDGLPEGTKFEYKDPIDTTTPGDKPVTVVVTYPDGSKDEVPSKVTVTP
ncbi:Rib/alpha-like domain-containing protein, partial [Streptococcus suis]